MIPTELKKLLTEKMLGLPVWVWMMALYICLDVIAAHYALTPTLPHAAHLHLPK